MANDKNQSETMPVIPERQLIYGVPEEFFEPSTHISPENQFELLYKLGKSGRELVCARSKNAIKIYDKEYGMGLNAPFIQAECSGGTISSGINIYTKNRQKHPDFEPRELMINCINYLINQGNEVLGFEAAWALKTRDPVHDSTNAKLFLASLDKLGIPLETNSKIDSTNPIWEKIRTAISTTWTGNLMQMLKWEAKQIEVTDRAIFVTFAAPNNQKSESIDISHLNFHNKLPKI